MYCMGEAWFNAREYSNELKLFKTLENAFVQGMDRLIRSQEHQQLTQSIQSTQLATASSQNAFLARMATFARPVVNVFVAFQSMVGQQIQQLGKQVAQTALLLANMPQRALQSLLPNLSSLVAGMFGLRQKAREVEDKINKEEFEMDAESYADNFIRRSQASAGARNS